MWGNSIKIRSQEVKLLCQVKFLNVPILGESPHPLKCFRGMATDY